MDLLSCNESEFNAEIGQLDMKYQEVLPEFKSIQGLILTVSDLQKEMAKEQQKFNDMSVELQSTPGGSPKHKELSESLVVSQNRLTALMGRNLKCFNQQTYNQQAEAIMKSKPEAKRKPESLRASLGNNIQNKIRSLSDPVNNNYQSSLKKSQAKKLDIQTSNNNNTRNSEEINNITPSNIQANDVKLQPVVINREYASPDKNRTQLKEASKPSKPNSTVPVEPCEARFMIIVDKDNTKTDTPDSATDLEERDTRFVISESKLDSDSDDSDVEDHITVPVTDRHTISSNGSIIKTPVTKKNQVPSNNKSSFSEPEKESEKGNAYDTHVKETIVIQDKLRKPLQATPDTQSTSSSDLPQGLTVTNGDGNHGNQDVVNDDVIVPVKISPVRNIPASFEKLFEQGNSTSFSTFKQASARSPSTNDASNVTVAKTDQAVVRPKSYQSVVKAKSVKSVSEESERKKTATTVILAKPPLRIVIQDRDDVESEKIVQSIRKTSETTPPKKESKPRSSTNSNSSTGSSMGNKFGVSVSTDREINGDITDDVIEYGHDGSERVKPRVTTKSWDPIKLLKDLYEVRYIEEVRELPKFINMKGFLEKLPINKKKATLLKTWKKRYFKAENGNLYYYDSNHTDKASGMFNMGGGEITDLGYRTLGIDDGRGHYLMVRCPSEQEYYDWRGSLESQVMDSGKDRYVKATTSCRPHHKKVIIIDLGSCSTRAGVLGEKPTLPQVFFPTVVATGRDTEEMHYGFHAYNPQVREKCNLVYPIKPNARDEKFNIDMSFMPGLFKKIFTDLNIKPSEYWVMLSAPQNLSLKMKEELISFLFKEFSVLGVNIMNQALLAMYSYNLKSGIVVDIGQRLEIHTITEGYIVEGGAARQAYGGGKVAEALNNILTEKKYHFFTETEKLIVRHVMEQSCYACLDFDEELAKYTADPKSFQETIDLKHYGLPSGTQRYVVPDLGRFKATEGLLNTDIWGIDSPSLPSLLQSAIQACPMDSRREMCRSICLSGGGTMFPGLAERLQKEISKVVASSITVQVHASPQRYHAAYIGACVLANMPAFERSSISLHEWKSNPKAAIQKWKVYAST